MQDVYECSDKNMEFTYILKGIAENLIMIYELAYINGLIRVNVYQFEYLLKSFPKNVIYNYLNIIDSHELISETKKISLTQELQLSTKLNTDSFNYDFHIKKIHN